MLGSGSQCPLQSPPPEDVFRRVGQLLSTELPKLEAATSQGAFKVWGEVIEVRRYAQSTRCQIRDKDQLVSLQAKLPAKVDVQIGDYILVHGSLTTMTKKSTGTATLIVEGTIAKNYSSKQLTALQATIAELTDQHKTSALPREAFQRVGVVTGYQSKALEDFRSALKSAHRRKLFSHLFQAHAKLRSPSTMRSTTII